MKKANKITLKGKCNWGGIGTLVVITLCLTSVMSPAMTQSSLSLFNNASDGTDGEIPEPTPTPTQTPTPGPSPTPSPSPSPPPSPSPSLTPTPGPIPTLTPTPSPTQTPSPSPSPSPAPAPPNITSFAPSSPVYDVEGETRTFNVTIDHVVNVSWLLNGTVVKDTEKGITEASCTNTSPAVGSWNVSVVATNENGTGMQTWTWNVSLQATPTPSPAPTPTPGPTPSPSPLTTPTPSPTPTPLQSLASNGTAAPSSTPIFIFGYVLYKNGAPCSSPIVNITNQNTSEEWQAETRPGYNYYQIVLAACADINASEILQFNVTDGANSNTTNYTVTPLNISKGVIFDFNLTLPFPALPVHLELRPDEHPMPGVQVINTNQSANKTVTITANVTDVNGYENIINTSVIATITGQSTIEDSPVSLRFVSNISAFTATHTGTFNMSNHSQGNYTVEVTATDTGGLEGIRSKNFTYLHEFPVSPPTVEMELTDDDPTTEGVQVINPDYLTKNRTVTITANVSDANGREDIVNVTANITGQSIVEDSPVSLTFVSNSSLTTAIYNGTFNMSNHSEGDYTVVVTATDTGGLEGTRSKNFTYLHEFPVSPPTVEMELTDDDPTTEGVQVINPDYLTKNRTVTITANVSDANGREDIVNVTANITGQSIVEDSPVSLTFVSNSSEFNATYNGTFNMSSHSEGGYKVEVEATNADGLTGISSQNFTYSYGPDLMVNISVPAFLPVNASNTITAAIKNNGTARATAEFSVTLTANGTFIDAVTVPSLDAGDITCVNFSWTPAYGGNYTLTVMADSDDKISESNESNNNRSATVFVGVHDFTVTALKFNIPELVTRIGDVVELNATIANRGVKDDTVYVEFYDNKSIKIHRTGDDYLGGAINDILTLPNACKIRVHFSYIGNRMFITVYDKNDFEVPITDNRWTEWASGDTIRIESYADFTVDRYEAVLANVSVSIGAGNHTTIPPVPVKWNLSDQYMGWATAGEHNITVMVDPYNQITETDEENNTLTEQVTVNPSLDFAVTNVSFNPPEPLLNDTVEINANITNFGVRTGTTFVEIYYDNRSIEIEREIGGKHSTSTDIISLPPGVLGARLHFESFSICSESGCYIKIYDKNNTVVEKLTASGNDYWTDYIYSEEFIRINSSGYYGGATAHGNTTFTIDRYEALIKRENIPLNASENKTVSVVWIANTTYGGAGPHNISARIDPHNSSVETCKTNNDRIEQILVNGTDLAITKMDIPCEVGHFGGESCRRGENKSINVTIANLGALNVTNFSISFRDGLGEGNESGVNTTFTTPAISNLSLNSGENTSINVTWTPVDFGKHTITINVSFVPLVDNDKTNNKRVVNVSVKPEYDFSVDEVSVHPKKVKEGENVTINVTIRNEGLKSGSVNVSFYVTSTDFVGSGDERYIEIGRTEKPLFAEPDNTNSTAITWTANVTGGDHLIYAVIDPDNEVAEHPEDLKRIGNSTILKDPAKAGNNVKSCLLHVNHQQLSITNDTLTLDPAEPVIENNVNVIALINNSGNETANSTVWFYMEKNVSWDASTSPKRVSLPEEKPIRVHFPYIKIKKNGPGGYDIFEYVISASVDGNPVDFYVKSKGVANGQPIKVPRIDFNTPCEYECDGYDLNAVCIQKHWEDVWTEWSVGKELVVTISSDTDDKTYRNFTIDKYQVRLGNQTIPIDANSSSSANVTWNVSLPLHPGDNYTLVANVEEEVLRKETCLNGTDLAVTNVSLKPGVWDGDLVRINATITNLGLKNATESFLVNFTEVYVLKSTHPQKENHVVIDTRLIGDLEAGNSTNISIELWNASIRKLDGKIAENFIIRVEVNPLNNSIFEVNTTNNKKEPEVHVNRSRDFPVTNLSFVVDNKTHNRMELATGMHVTLNASVNVTNHANQGGNVNISFYFDNETLINETSVGFYKGNGTEYGTIEWEVVDDFVEGVEVAGNHTITVVADPENEIYERNESNNASTWQIHVMAPELVIENFSIKPETLKRDDNATINVTIANRGRLNATRDFNFTIYDWAERHIDNVADIEQYKGFQTIPVKRTNATAMRLYLDLEIEELHDPEIEKEKGGEVCIYDNQSRGIRCYNYSFHGWTPWILDNNIRVETIKETKINRYLFCWDNVPGTESERLITYLTDDLGRDWAENATINKTDDGRTIQISAENNSANLTLGEHNETASLEINGDNVPISLIVKKENGRLKIYNRETCDTYAYAKVSKVYYLMQSDINTTTHDLAINETANISVEWAASPVGERFIAAIIDPEGVIMEYNESNNMLARFISVKTADLEVSNLSLWLNGTEIGEDTIVRDNDTVKITANATNIGIEETDDDFSVYFLVDDVLIPEGGKIIPNLAPNKTIPLVANWTAEVGMHVIKVEADYENEINETNETNNIAVKPKYVCGAEMRGNESWESSGLHGLNGTILFDPAQPYDEDEVNITVNITNYGYVNASDFNVLLSYGGSRKSYDSFMIEGGTVWRSGTVIYPGAEWVYIQILDRARKTTPGKWNPVDADDVEVYDAWGNEVLNETNFNTTCRWAEVREGKSCWIPVRGNKTTVRYHSEPLYNPVDYTIYVYEISRLFGGINVPVNSSSTVSMKQNVSVGNFTVMAVIDPENRVPEDNKTDNIVSRTMRVNATRDFTVTKIIPKKTDLLDTGTTNITANVSNVGYRNGTTRVEFIDYENETRIHKYYFDDKNLTWSYLPMAPDVISPENLTIIHRPGVDSITLYFKWITLYMGDTPRAQIWVSDRVCEYKDALWTNTTNIYCDEKTLKNESILVPGETAYIYTRHANFNLSGYTTKKELFCEDCENVTLNASVTWNESTKNITARWSESKNITAPRWNASTGNHNITVTIDPANETSEINESNNTFILPVPVAASRDPEIVELNLTPAHPEHGDNVTITAVVRNNGCKTANFTLDLWAETTRRLTAGPVPPESWNISVQEQEDKIRYVRLLNRTNVSLEPGVSEDRTAVWENMSVYGNPTYIVRAIVDPLDEIDEGEMSESNNEYEMEISMNYPDLTIAKFNSPTRETNETNASVNIENMGPVNASSEFNVSLDLIKHEFRPSTAGDLNITNGTVDNITMEGATQIRIHFASLDTTLPGDASYIDILGKDGERYDGYEGEKLENVWTEWVPGDTIYIEHLNAIFYVDQYGCGNIYQKERASKMRICFDSLDTTGWNSYIDIYEKKVGGEEEEEEGEWNRVQQYSDVESGYECTQWANGDTILIDYTNAYFNVKELWWKEENIERINSLNASKSKNVSIPTWKYEGLQVLNVTVDPENKIIEQKEDNNTKGVIIYADLMPKGGIGTVFGADGKLKGINVTILNNKALKEDEGILFPVSKFSVELRHSSGESIKTKRIGESENENETIYGGESYPLLFDVNESVLPANRTYYIDVIVDSEKEIQEIDDENNEILGAAIGPDIVVDEIDISTDALSCNSTITAIIKNEGSMPAEDFWVRLYLNGSTGNETEDIFVWERLVPEEGKNVKNVTFLKKQIAPNKIYNVTIVADPPDQAHPKGRVEELDDDNNEEGPMRIGPDLEISDINFYDKDGDKREGDKLIVHENHTISVMVNNKGSGGAKKFVLDLWINDSNGNEKYREKHFIDYCISPGVSEPVNLSWKPWRPDEKGFYYIKAFVDPKDPVDNVTELEDYLNPNYYPWAPDEDIWRVIPGEELKAGEPGYEAKEGYMPMFIGEIERGEIQGGIIYHVGDTERIDISDASSKTNFSDPVPENASVELVRLYVYPDWAFYEDAEEHKMAFLPDKTMLEVTFNGKLLGAPDNPTDFTPKVNPPDQPTDIPDATEWNTSYATYRYDVTGLYEKGANNLAEVKKQNPPNSWYGISGMALLIVYKDNDAPLIRYWVGEDRDAMYAKIDSHESTGFGYDECTRKVRFNNVTDAPLANATLKAVLVSYNPSKTLCNGAKGTADALYFNPKNINQPNPNHEKLKILPLYDNKGHWHKLNKEKTDIALTNRNDGWEYVDVENGINYAAIQSRGAMMCAAHAILKVEYPPDLEPSVPMQLKATAGTSYNIPITIHNWGKSKAKNFNVTVSIDGNEVYNDTIPEIKGVGQDGNSIPLKFTKKAPLVEGWVKHNVTVVVDTEDNVKELINKHPHGYIKMKSNGEENNEWNDTVTVVVNPPGPGGPGGGGGTGGGWGEGNGTGEGSGSGEGRGVAGGSGEGGAGESGGKTIRGRLMKGTVVSGKEAGGGGKGEFSVVRFLMQLVMLAAALALVCAGYLLERRRQNHKQ